MELNLSSRVFAQGCEGSLRMWDVLGACCPAPLPETRLPLCKGFRSWRREGRASQRGVGGSGCRVRRGQARGQRLLGATNLRPPRQVASLVPRMAPLLGFGGGRPAVVGAAEQSQSQVQVGGSRRPCTGPAAARLRPRIRPGQPRPARLAQAASG